MHTDTHIQRHAYTPGKGVLSAGDVLQQNTFVALQHTATHCNALQHIATRCTATHCNALQHTATLCNTLQHSATLCATLQHLFVYILLYYYRDLCSLALFPIPLSLSLSLFLSHSPTFFLSLVTCMCSMNVFDGKSRGRHIQQEQHAVVVGGNIFA